jgi:hypothetical protein
VCLGTDVCISCSLVIVILSSIKIRHALRVLSKKKVCYLISFARGSPEHLLSFGRDGFINLKLDFIALSIKNSTAA